MQRLRKMVWKGHNKTKANNIWKERKEKEINNYEMTQLIKYSIHGMLWPKIIKQYNN